MKCTRKILRISLKLSNINEVETFFRDGDCIKYDCLLKGCLQNGGCYSRDI